MDSWPFGWGLLVAERQRQGSQAGLDSDTRLALTKWTMRRSSFFICLSTVP